MIKDATDVLRCCIRHCCSGIRWTTPRGLQISKKNNVTLWCYSLLWKRNVFIWRRFKRVQSIFIRQTIYFYERMAILSKFVQNVTTVLYSNAGAFLLLYKYFLFQLPFFVDFQSGLTHTIKSTLHPEEHIGYKHSQATFLSKITFFWLTPLIWHGYQNPLEFDDLGALHESDTCRTQYDRFHFIYNSFKVRFIYYYH